MNKYVLFDFGLSLIELKETVELWQKYALVLFVFNILNTWAVY